MERSTAEKRQVTYRDVFHNGNWIRLWTGQTISQLGDAVSDIAFPLLVYEITKSPVGLGLGFGVEMLPLIVIGPIAGVFVDHWNRRTLLLVADFVRIGCALGMFLSTSVWQLYVLALLAAIMQAIFLATYSATIPQITQEQFTKSISLSYMGYKTMQVIGPMLAAIIIGLAGGPRAAFLFDTATFTVGFLLTLTISVANVERQDPAKNFLQDLGVGLSFLWQNAALRYIASYHVVFIIVSAASALGTVLYIKLSLGLSATLSDQLYGITGVVLAGSMAFMAWLIGLLDERISKRTLMLYAPVVAGLAYLLFLLHPGPTWILPIFFVVSVGNACGLLSFQTLLAHSIPNHLRGRVYSFFNAIGSVANLAAYGLFAALGLLLSPATLLALAGMILLIGIPLCTLVFKGNQALRAQEASENT
ncbi:MFS transporter [Ktedonosporobacter rubrisoli]|uniref:MFS transporter n=1 Tax=Ktedonosporobacter rubrisoli TaxID=2509675 RepID=A0A4P6K4V9_KTERU|nr:MFS transporter [Ktedonosporobacter rubrisoli]QBD82880.1 MFS transporter [Ktedonosporobacter rubrisoli]